MINKTQKEVKDIHQLLQVFDQLWNDAINGKYQSLKLKEVAKEIKKEHDAQSQKELSNTENESLSKALIIANL